jgi:N-acetylglucosaminyl-diphospho-decaprenol L-rhamnosyltransferase
VDDSANNLHYPSLPLLVIRNNCNRGFATASNQGAAGSTADYLLFLNPDTRVLHDTLARSIRYMDDPGNDRVGIVGVQLLDANGAVSRTCARFPATRYFVYAMLGLDRLFPRLFPSLWYVEWDHLQSRSVDHVMGAYLHIRNSLFKQLNGFDERFFVYLEDVDLSLRAWQAGWSSYYLATAQCYHAGGGTTRQIMGRRMFYGLTSRILYAFKNFAIANAITLLLLTLFVEPVTRLLMATMKGSMTRVGQIIEGYTLLWGNLPAILRGNYPRKTEALPP